MRAHATNQQGALPATRRNFGCLRAWSTCQRGSRAVGGKLDNRISPAHRNHP